jgi:hypothetical protein
MFCRGRLTEDVLSILDALEDDAEETSYQSAAIAGCIVAKANLAWRYSLRCRDLAGVVARVVAALELAHCR